jgi:spore coat polysaccharide biosynthesis protein SpsF
MVKQRGGNFETTQESFWAGEFGDEYVLRNQSETLRASNIALFSTILESTAGIVSLIEYGANVGLNLIALRHLLPAAQLAAVEINEKAVERLRALGGIDVNHSSMLEFVPDRTYDLVLSKGVLIHLNPEELPRAYALLHQSTARYICIAEYYNPTPVAVTSRGHAERLFKRDFAGEMLDRFADLALVKYGFAYHRDPVFPQDDITWFLLEKRFASEREA